MSLTKGSGPFAPGSDVQIYRANERTLLFEPSPRRVRVRFGNRTIADSDDVKLLHETGALPVYYFPKDDVDLEVIGPSADISDPLKGGGTRFDICIGDRASRNAAYQWTDPPAEAAFLVDHIAFEFDAVDAWFEEDERIDVHPRDPYHRIDVVRSSRHVRVLLDDTVIADTRRALMLFETGLPPRYYIPERDMAHQFLVSSTKITRCPYKGEAAYWSVDVGGQCHEDVIWCYPQPRAETDRIEGMYSLWQERRPLTVEVDGSTL